jgi:hypothetical protein
MTAVFQSGNTHDKNELIRLENEWVNTSDPAFFERVLADDEVHIIRAGLIINKSEEINFCRKNVSQRNAQKDAF